MLLFGGRGGRGEFPAKAPMASGAGAVALVKASSAGAQGGFGGGGGGGGFGGGRRRSWRFGWSGRGLGGMRGGGRMQGNGNYNLGGSMFDAAPYPLNGRVREEPDYVQQRYGSSIGGPLTIPRVYNGGTRTSFFVNYCGNHSRTPVDTVFDGADAGRARGRFLRQRGAVIDPATGQPFTGNRIPSSRIDPAAQTLLAYIPVPNRPGDTQNFHYVTANSRRATTSISGSRTSSAHSPSAARAAAAAAAGRPWCGSRGGSGAGRAGPGGRRTARGARSAADAQRAQCEPRLPPVVVGDSSTFPTDRRRRARPKAGTSR